MSGVRIPPGAPFLIYKNSDLLIVTASIASLSPGYWRNDVADAAAGVVHGLTNRAEIWARHGIKPVDVPASIRHTAIDSGADKKVNICLDN